MARTLTRPPARLLRTFTAAATALLLALGSGAGAFAAQTATSESIARWDLITAPTITDASIAANVFGSVGGADRDATLRPVTTDPLTGYTYDDSEHSVRYQGWNDGVGIKSWLLEVSTRGYTDITVSSQQRSSGTGPRDFAVQVSVDGQTTWQTVPDGEVTVGGDFTSGTVASLPLPASAAGHDRIAIRWVVTSTDSVGGGTVGATGSSRITGVSVSGIPTGGTPPVTPDPGATPSPRPTPEPTPTDTPAAPPAAVAARRVTPGGDAGVLWSTGGANGERAALTSVGTNGDYGFHSDRGNAVSVQGWGAGAHAKYWLAALSTKGFTDLTLSSEHSASGSGPRDLAVEMSIDKQHWSAVPDTAVTAPTHTFDCPDGSCRLQDVPLPAAASDADVLYLRWIMTSNDPSNTDENDTVGGFGDSFIRNIRVSGDPLNDAPHGSSTFDVRATPADAAVTVALDADATLRFNKDIAISDDDSISIVDEAGAHVKGVKATTQGGMLRLAHDRFAYGHRYTVTVPAGAIRGTDGVATTLASTWSFSTLSKRPTAFTMNFNGDTRTSMSFAWYTPTEITDTVVEVAPAAARHGDDFPSKDVTRYSGRSETISTFVTEADRDARRTSDYSSHKVTADGLAPGTAYVYRVGDGTTEGWGRIGSFTTDAATAKPFHFLFGSDSQASDLGSFLEWQDTFKKAVDRVDDPRFLLVSGDLVDNGDLEEQWQWMLNSAADQFATVPYVPVLGGHEVEDSGTLPNNNFYNHFNEPKDAAGTGAHDGSVYSFEHGDALFMQFNSQFGGYLDDNGEVARMDTEFATQLDWMRREVAETDARWKFVALHKGPYSAGENVCYWEADRVAFYEKMLVPVFQETGVDVVLEAHDHMYMRSHQMLDGRPVDTITDENGQIVVQYDVTDPDGILYLMPNALGNKFYETPDGCDTSFAAINAQPEKKMFVDFGVTHDKLTLTAYTAAVEDENGDDGLRVFDHYTITRTDGTPAPVHDAAVSVSGDRASFSWRAPADSPEPVRGYRIYEKHDRVGANWSAYIPAEQGRSDYTFEQSLSDDPTVRYEFVIRAVGAKDNSTPVAVTPARTSEDSTPPSTPTGLSARAQSQFRVDLSWLPSVDDTDVTGYKVYRDGKPVTRTTASTFTDVGLNPGTTYEYSVSAYDAAGNESERSVPLQASTPLNPTGPNPQRPFGQHTGYAPGTLRPSISQAQMDSTVAGLYDAWKGAYLTQNPYEDDQYYVYYNGNGEAGEDAPDAVTTSESNGYGMLITAIMAGHDPRAKVYFDGLLRFRKAHPSSMDPGLMAWQQRDDGTAIVDSLEYDEEGNAYGNDAATDGDLDMAYALLLADRQWGSGGDFDYLGDARDMMKSLMNSGIHPSQNIVLLGDWTSDEPVYGRGTRTSDFMIQHFKDFAVASGSPRWNAVADSTQKVSRQLFEDYSPNTGLLPDFAFQEGDGYRPADPDFLESEFDGAYNWNASRVPWRLGTDYLLTGDDRTKDQLATMNKWIRTATGGDPTQIAQGYTLDGKALDEPTDLAFSAPFTISAMVEGGDQGWLDALWSANTAEPVTSYFGDSVRMLSLIVASGNWWSPTGLGVPQDVVVPDAPSGLTATATGADSVRLNWNAAPGALHTVMAARGTVLGYRVYRDGHAIASVADGTTFVDTGLRPDTKYTYQVTAIDHVGQESAPSASVSVTTNADTTGPGTPGTPSDPGDPGKHGADSSLAGTGAELPLGVALVGALLLVLGGGFSVLRRRPHPTAPGARVGGDR